MTQIIITQNKCECTQRYRTSTQKHQYFTPVSYMTSVCQYSIHTSHSKVFILCTGSVQNVWFLLVAFYRRAIRNFAQTSYTLYFHVLTSSDITNDGPVHRVAKLQDAILIHVRSSSRRLMYDITTSQLCLSRRDKPLPTLKSELSYAWLLPHR